MDLTTNLKRLKITKKEFAKLLGVSYITLRKWEKKGTHGERIRLVLDEINARGEFTALDTNGRYVLRFLHGRHYINGKARRSW